MAGCGSSAEANRLLVRRLRTRQPLQRKSTWEFARRGSVENNPPPRHDWAGQGQQTKSRSWCRGKLASWRHWLPLSSSTHPVPDFTSFHAFRPFSHSDANAFSSNSLVCGEKALASLWEKGRKAWKDVKSGT